MSYVYNLGLYFFTYQLSMSQNCIFLVCFISEIMNDQREKYSF